MTVDASNHLFASSNTEALENTSMPKRKRCERCDDELETLGAGIVCSGQKPLAFVHGIRLPRETKKGVDQHKFGFQMGIADLLSFVMVLYHT